MSQVIESHVLRVGQTVCISSPEESKSLHPAGYPGKYVYYSTEAWTDPPSMVHPKARLLPGGRAYGAQPVSEHVAAHTQGKGQQNSSLERPPALCQPKEEENTSVDPEAQPVSPSLDISIETLNQLILEIDPTFQPLPCRPVKDAAQPAAQGDTAATKKQDPEAVGEAKAALGLWSQRGSCLVKTLCWSLGQRGRAHTCPLDPHKVLERLEMGIRDVPHCPQQDQHGGLFPDIRVPHEGAGQAVYPSSA